MSRILNVINYFWKLGYNEEQPDVYIKNYSDSFNIAIDMAQEKIIYGEKMIITDKNLTKFSQINFVIMESIDRLLRKGYQPNSIITNNTSDCDYIVYDQDKTKFIALKCQIWEEEYDEEVESYKSESERLINFFTNIPDVKYLCIYTSRLKAGLIECRYTIFPNFALLQANKLNNSIKNEFYSRGLFEERIYAYKPEFDKNKEDIHYQKQIIVNGTDEFKIHNGTLVEYRGNNKDVVIPNGVKKIQNSLFWNCTSLETIKIPESVISLGGDTFYFCTNLQKLTIPASVEIMGDNPFGNCPKLQLTNKSPFFVFKDGALYNKEMTRLIYYSIEDKQTTFNVPEGVISISKHAFYNSKNLEKITVPKTVKIMENNPFSNCPNLTIENNSPHFIMKDGALYNKNMTTLFYYENKNNAKSIIIPEGVKIIGRHSFFNCKNLEYISIPNSVKIIGYNPFTGCSSLMKIDNQSYNYAFENGILYDDKKIELIHSTIKGSPEDVIVPNTVKTIGRSAFYGCNRLKSVTIPESVKIIERSAFAYCKNLKNVIMPQNIKILGEWAFYNCINLKQLMIPKNIEMGNNTFLNCPAKITYY